MDFIKRLNLSPLIRNITAVASGAAVGQAVVFAFSPLITRIYTPEAFGLQGLFLSMLSILSPLIALRYPMAIVVAKDDNDAYCLLRLSLLIAFGISCLLVLVLAVALQPISALLGAAALGPLIWFLPLALFCIALQDVMDYRASRLGAFRLIAHAAVAQAFVANVARVLGGILAPVPATLVAVTSLAPAIRALLLMRGARNRRRPAAPFDSSAAAACLTEHRDFPLYRMPTDMLNAASQAVPVILLAALFSPEAAGFYTLTRSVLNLPSNILGMAIGNVLYARFAELARRGSAVAPLLLKATGTLLIPAPVIVGLAWFAPPVFAFVFGEEWREAGFYARWMSLWITMMIVNVPTMRTLPVIGGQRPALVFNILLLLVRSISVLGVYWFSGGALAAVACFSVSSALSIALAIMFFTVYTIRFDRDQRKIAHG